MLITLALVYLVVSVAFFGALAFAARQPIPAMSEADLNQTALGSSLDTPLSSHLTRATVTAVAA